MTSPAVLAYDDDLVEVVSEAVEPGSSAPSLLACDADTERIAEVLEGTRFDIVETSPSQEDGTRPRKSIGAVDAPG